MNSSALSLKGSSELSLLVFNGKKDTFRVWSRKFMNYLEGLTIELTGLWIGESDKRPQPVTKFEDWLVSVPALHQSEIDATEKYKHYLDWYRKRQDQKVRSLLVQLLPVSFIQQLRDGSDSKMPVHEIWSEVQKRYGVSNAASVTALMGKFIRTAGKSFDTIESWFGELKSQKNLINAQSRQYLSRDSVSDDLLICLALNELPSQFYGAQVKYTPDSFNVNSIEQILVGIFGQCSKRAILAMAGQSSATDVACNSISTNRNEKKRPTNQGPVLNGKRPKLSGPAGPSRTDPRDKCPKMSQDLSYGYERKNIWSKPEKVEPRAPKNNVPCGAIRAEVPLPRQAEVPLPASTSPAEESLADYLGLGLDDDFEASSPYYTPAQERMEAVAGSMQTMSVDMDDME
ncbi:hypothetical protein AaE_015129 [Aphanomyces astaci]|uniref:Uncharacterized protein n=1 Tax=Aphanomyces astaci TaxID=112090 RepID=A0A6A4Z3R3_APHAT|nr:hypothetical protein AaE_015129 [Aphanomyces astaci]